MTARLTRCEHGFLPPLCPQCHEGMPDKSKAMAAAALEGTRVPGKRKGSGTSIEVRDRQGRRRHPSFVDMTGQRIGPLVVLNEGPPGRHSTVRWWCQCDCGAEPCLMESIKLRKAAKEFAAGTRKHLYCPACRPLFHRGPHPKTESGGAG